MPVCLGAISISDLTPRVLLLSGAVGGTYREFWPVYSVLGKFVDRSMTCSNVDTRRYGPLHGLVSSFGHCNFKSFLNQTYCSVDILEDSGRKCECQKKLFINSPRPKKQNMYFYSTILNIESNVEYTV